MSKEFHPSLFENLTPNLSTESASPGDFGSISSIKEQRNIRRFGSEFDPKSLVSPGRFKLTDNDNSLSGSNTRHLFKNLEGDPFATRKVRQNLLLGE